MMKTRFAAILAFLTIFTAPAGAAIVPAPPAINASAYLVMDFDSGRLLVSDNVDSRIEPASLTKMMTVYVIGEELKSGHIHMDDMVRVSEKAWRMEGSKMFIEVNKEVAVHDLLRGIVIQSGNDASVAMAEYIAGSEDVFAAIMNDTARKLGMKNSHFVNATGWPDPEHYSTAHDLAILGEALIRNHPELYAMHSEREFTFNGIKQQNRNELLGRDDSVDGIKTGHTESAGYCLVASAKRDNMRLISVVTGTDSPDARTRATQSLLNYAFRFFETRRLYAANQTVASAKVWKGEKEKVNLGIDRDLYVTFTRGEFDSLDAAADIPGDLVAPVARGTERGTLTVKLDGKELARRPLLTLENVNQGSLFVRLRDEINLLFR
jgi:serine-type D-Ala-D-Ala carboxypeptidase (penicillin-binding protein 5/6)